MDALACQIRLLIESRNTLHNPTVCHLWQHVTYAEKNLVMTPNAQGKVCKNTENLKVDFEI